MTNDPETPTPTLSAELESAIKAYGDASFDCGEWDGENDMHAGSIDYYREVADKCDAARASLMAVFQRELSAQQKQIEELKAEVLKLTMKGGD